MGADDNRGTGENEEEEDEGETREGREGGKRVRELERGEKERGGGRERESTDAVVKGAEENGG